MGFIQEKFTEFLSLFLAFFIQLRPNSHPSTSSQYPSPPSPPSATADGGMPPSLPPFPPPPSSETVVVNSLAAQQNQQIWRNPILSFCFSFALGICLQFPQSGESKSLPTSLALLSFAVLVTFSLHSVLLFVGGKHATTSIVMETIALFVAAAAFSHATAIPFPLNLKYVTWALFCISWFLILVCRLLYGRGEVSP
ncbi:hypothetical protein V6N13_037617 [Hibiscus sabdariffa]